MRNPQRKNHAMSEYTRLVIHLDRKLENQTQFRGIECIEHENRLFCSYPSQSFAFKRAGTYSSVT